ncbi:MAG: hypothetical protein BGP12_07470 [Rhodospirillales bacterium 70-18]|nr:MAG: hypothetical protein BGP12_07470 [Rhodospirillales bacterium 70-18]
MTAAPHTQTRARPRQGLFAEDFDAPAGVTLLDAQDDPEVIASRFPAEAVEAAREDGYAEGFRSGLSQATQDRAEIARQLLAAIAERLAAAEAQARQAAEASAEAVAGLLMASLGALFPALCARHGGGEVAALARAVLPALDSEPRITIRVSPHVTTELAAELDRLDPELRARIVLVPTDAVPPGDVRIAWQDGIARRDGAALWAQVADTLSQYGLDAPSLAAAPAQ